MRGQPGATLTTYFRPRQSISGWRSMGEGYDPLHYLPVVEKRLVKVVPKGAFPPLFAPHSEGAVVAGTSSSTPRDPLPSNSSSG